MSLSRFSSTMPHSQNRSRIPLAELLRAVEGGDRGALAEIYRQVESSVYAFALSRLADADAAADVLQDVMLTIWRRAGTFGGRSKARTWILGIAHHKIADRWRRRDRDGYELPDENAIDPDAPCPHLDAEQGERQKAVRRSLRSLSDAHREVVHLAFYEDLSYSEIARILEIPEGMVKTRVFHAKKILARRLGADFAGDSP